LRVEILTDYPERLAQLDTVYVGPHHQPYEPVRVRLHKGAMLLTLASCTDRDAAEALRGALVQIRLEDAVPLEQDEYYHYQLEGLAVETDQGERLGEIVEVLSPPGANDVYVVYGPRGELLIPAIEDVVMDIDMDAEKIVIHVLPGLFEP
jgi:16S rRNA processing protein RimM